jgi:hypothetical protein
MKRYFTFTAQMPGTAEWNKSRSAPFWKIVNEDVKIPKCTNEFVRKSFCNVSDTAISSVAGGFMAAKEQWTDGKSGEKNP